MNHIILFIWYDSYRNKSILPFTNIIIDINIIFSIVKHRKFLVFNFFYGFSSFLAHSKLFIKSTLWKFAIFSNIICRKSLTVKLLDIFLNAILLCDFPFYNYISQAQHHTVSIPRDIPAYKQDRFHHRLFVSIFEPHQIFPLSLRFSLNH